MRSDLEIGSDLQNKSDKSSCPVKFSARNSGAGNGGANFMGAWKNAFFLQEKKSHVHKIPRFRGGGCLGFFLGGGVPILFYGREDFSE